MKDLLKYEKYNGYFTWRPTDIYENISLKCFEGENFSDKSCRETQNTHFVFNIYIYIYIYIFFFENGGCL